MFTIKGVPVNEYLDQSKADYEKEKENMKIARVGNKIIFLNGISY